MLKIYSKCTTTIAQFKEKMQVQYSVYGHYTSMDNISVHPQANLITLNRVFLLFS